MLIQLMCQQQTAEGARPPAQGGRALAPPMTGVEFTGSLLVN